MKQFTKSNKISKTLKFNNSQPKKKLNLEDELEETQGNSQYLGYFKEHQTATKLSAYIDEDVKSPSYYRMLLSAIEDLGEGDMLELVINSPGGDLSGLVSLLTAIKNTDASTTARIVGEAHSAASILALATDSIEVSPLATMLVHSVRFGLGASKGHDAASQVRHINAHAEQIFKDAYEHFLSPDEIVSVLEGRELWLDFEEISKRLEHKYSILNREQDDEDSNEDEEDYCCNDPSNCPDIVNCPNAEDDPDEYVED